MEPESRARISLASAELNRVLGGGLVAGSVVLLAGEPGVGKSTLLLQVAQSVAALDQPVVYVSGEESPHQIKIRADRIGMAGKGILVWSETDVDRIVDLLMEHRPGLVIIDSIQTLYCQEAPSSPGTVAQVREAGLRLMRWAKTNHVPVIVAGHVTKEGSVAGPRVLEHMVDVVAYLESQDATAYRLLRNTKNRFGSTTEVGVFEMTERGMEEVPDPSRAFLGQRDEPAVGTVVVPVVEGSRPLLLEVQSLTAYSQASAPRRVTNGFDFNRLLMLAAVGSRRAGLELGAQDIIVNVAGGFRITEPAADLAVMLAMGSSLSNHPLPATLVAFGEVGLSGELRSVPQVERRLAEASRLGMTRSILPESGLQGVEVPRNMEVIPAKTVRQALRSVLASNKWVEDFALSSTLEES